MKHLSVNSIIRCLLLTLLPLCSSYIYDSIEHEQHNSIDLDDALRTEEIVEATAISGGERADVSYDDQRQKKVWDMINDMDYYKGSSALYTRGSDRSTLTSFHYLIQPTWWSDQNQNDPDLLMNIDLIRSSMDETVQYYKDMSWDKMTITYEILPQRALSVSSVNPRLYQAKSACDTLVSNQGYNPAAYDGTIFFYQFAQTGDLIKGVGAKGQTNGNFIWLNPDHIASSVIRHEIGHNFGHDHHGRNTYWYRESRPYLSGVTDGFDMMGGGNPYNISDFSVASKWFYNWVSDSSIVNMQPEGSTPECPTCLKSGTFKLKPFDMRDGTPTESDKLGIHIPIATVFDSYYNSNWVYSYWISYRSGVDGDASNGISIHLAWFELYGLFGAYYDSMIYDTVGDTASKLDSFVGKGSCYHISPAAYMKDRDFMSAEAIQPVVCVDDITPGTDITVSITFLDENNPPPKAVEVIEKPSIQCTSQATEIAHSYDTSKFNLFHVHSTGSNGLMHVSFDSQNSLAYIYDDYPYSPINFDSDPSYGSFASVTSGETLQYQTEFGEAWVLIPPSNNANPSLRLFCETTTYCLSNYFLSNGSCSPCPTDYLSDAGSTSLSDCKRCPDGTGLIEPQTSQCSLLETFSEIQMSKKWRIWAPKAHSLNGWSWAVTNLSFYSDLQCQNVISPTGVAIDSGNAGFSYLPINAFTSSGTWGGRVDNDDAFWIGMEFNSFKSVKCVTMTSKTNHVTEIRVQSYIESEGKWENAWIENILDTNSWKVTTEIKLDYGSDEAQPIAAPSTYSPPTSTPTKAKTMMPTQSPTAADIGTEEPICKEDGSTKYLLKLKTNGKPVRRSCLSLSTKTAAKIENICTNSIDIHALADPPKIACPVTCGCENSQHIESPTASPTASPTLTPIQSPTASPTLTPNVIIPAATTGLPTSANPISCQESEATQYLFRVKNNGKPVTRTCGSLSKLLPFQKQDICENEVGSHNNFDSAKIACPVSCGCGDIEKECVENLNDVFLLKKAYGANGATSVTRTCSWLQGRPASKIESTCKSTMSFQGYLPASAVCFQTCNSSC